jgi:hypothetical protein
MARASMYFSPSLNQHHSHPLTHTCSSTRTPHTHSQSHPHMHTVGNINILDCNPMSDRRFSHPTDSQLSKQVLHASTNEFPIFLAPSDSQFCTPNFLLFSDAPMTRPTIFRLTATLSVVGVRIPTDCNSNRILWRSDPVRPKEVVKQDFPTLSTIFIVARDKQAI